MHSIANSDSELWPNQNQERNEVRRSATLISGLSEENVTAGKEAGSVKNEGEELIERI